MRYTRGDSGKETFLVADIKPLEKMDASEIHAKRINAKEVLTLQMVAFKKRSQMEQLKYIHLNPGSPRPRRRTRKTFQENQTGLLQLHFKTHRCMMLKQNMISGPLQAILFTVITWNPESNCPCREKRYSLFH